MRILKRFWYFLILGSILYALYIILWRLHLLPMEFQLQNLLPLGGTSEGFASGFGEAIGILALMLYFPIILTIIIILIGILLYFYDRNQK